MNKLLDKLRSKLRLTLLTKGSDIKHLDVKEIPEKWEEFGSSKDKWIKVIYPESENVSGCLYIGEKGSEFSPHIHKDNTEHITILNKEGKIEVVTDTYTKIISYPDSIIIEKGVPHAILFREKTRASIIWHPMFENGWQAEFIED